MAKGSKYIIPGRKEEWEKFYKETCADKNSVSMCMEILSIIRMLYVGITTELVVPEFDTERYPDFILNWINKNVAKFFPNRIKFATSPRMTINE